LSRLLKILELDKFSAEIFSFVLGYLGFCYEILISRLATIYIGGSFYQLTVLIGLFTFFMGMASLMASFFTENQIRIFQYSLRVHFFLLGALALLVRTEWFILREQYFWFLVASLFGFITGIEIPVLICIYKNRSEKIMSLDYLGLFLAALFFPLFFLKTFSINQILTQCLVIVFALNIFSIKVFKNKC